MRSFVGTGIIDPLTSIIFVMQTMRTVWPFLRLKPTTIRRPFSHKANHVSLSFGAFVDCLALEKGVSVDEEMACTDRGWWDLA